MSSAHTSRARSSRPSASARTRPASGAILTGGSPSRCSAAGRMALVTDAVSGAGVGDGSYRLGSVDVEIENGVVRRADSVLAGSTVTMIDAVRNLVELGAPLAGALAAASEVPARVAGRSDVGHLRPGA